MTLSQVNQAQLNRLFANSNQEEEKNWFKFVWGRKVRLSFNSDLSTAYVARESLFLVPEIMDLSYAGEEPILNATILADSTCDVMVASCPEVMDANGYSNHADCVNELKKLPLASENSRGLLAVDGNTTGCRNLHASLAEQNPAVHCPHLSFKPFIDPRGDTKCSKSADLSQADYFAEKDFNLFRQTAYDTGLDPLTLLEPTEKTDTCVTELLDPKSIAQNVPDNYYCQVYLEGQKATGENNSIYTAALFGFWIVCRVLAFFLLRSKGMP